MTTWCAKRKKIMNSGGGTIMAILITGGSGFVGANLAKELVSQGEEVVLFDIRYNQSLVAPLEGKVKMVEGDLSSKVSVTNAVEQYGIKKVFHCGALLSHSAEEDILTAYEVNLLGTWYVLEAARLFGVEQVIFTSTVASFGKYIDDGPVSNSAPQYPSTLYGVSKVSSERLGEYYKTKFGVDFRGLRFPSVIGAGRGPGGASAYSSLMIDKAARNESYPVNVAEHCRIPLLYIKDAVKGLIALSQADEKKLNYRMYNLAAYSPSAREVATEIEQAIPGYTVTFDADPALTKIIDSWPAVLDDSEATKDWQWSPDYDLKKTVLDIIVEARK
jgi:threonine 3-dehydrogenase